MPLSALHVSTDNKNLFASRTCHRDIVAIPVFVIAKRGCAEFSFRHNVRFSIRFAICSSQFHAQLRLVQDVAHGQGTDCFASPFEKRADFRVRILGEVE